ncbi:MAG: PA14 domain-containing protein, partial [Planctomycetota bacterium]
EAGTYDFELASDDGSELIIGGETVVNFDGLHSAEIPLEETVELEAGTFPIKLRMFDNTVSAVLRLKWRTPGSDQFVLLPADVLRTEANQVRVTSPGSKQFEVPGGDILNSRRPGDRKPLEAPHPATQLVGLRPDGFEPKVGGMDFLPDGRLVLCTWDPRGDVFIVDNVTGEGSKATARVTRFATGLAEPLGLKVIEGDDGPRIFVLQKQELTELIDTDDDGVADVYRAAVTGWPVSDNFHEFAFGLEEMDGKLIGMLAVAINPGGATTVPQMPERGTAIVMDPDDGTYEVIAAGLRTPNGIAEGVDGELFIYDNQGDWLPCSKIVHLKKDAFYNSYITPNHPLSEGPITPPAVWLPQ